MKTLPFALILSGLLSTTTAYATDSCVVGLWRADIQDIANTMAAQTGGTGTARGGNAEMRIKEDGGFDIVTDDVRINMVPPTGPAVDVTVSVFAVGSITATEGEFATEIDDFSLSAAADVLGQRMEIPFDRTTGGIIRSASGTYSCTSSELRFDVAPPMPEGSVARLWRRVS